MQYSQSRFRKSDRWFETAPGVHSCCYEWDRDFNKFTIGPYHYQRVQLLALAQSSEIEMLAPSKNMNASFTSECSWHWNMPFKNAEWYQDAKILWVNLHILSKAQNCTNQIAYSHLTKNFRRNKFWNWMYSPNVPNWNVHNTPFTLSTSVPLCMFCISLGIERCLTPLYTLLNPSNRLWAVLWNKWDKCMLNWIANGELTCALQLLLASKHIWMYNIQLYLMHN